MATSLLAIVADCRDSLAQAKWPANVLGHRGVRAKRRRVPGQRPVECGYSALLHERPGVEEGQEPAAHRNHDRRIPRRSRLIAAGGTLVEMRQDPATLANPDTWAVLQDPEGKEFCVINADSITGMA